MPQVSKEQIVDIIEDMARLLELKGENVFKIRAYTNAARALETFTGDFKKAVAEETLTSIPGVGKAIADKIKELHETGTIHYFDKLKAEFPPGLFEIFELQGLGPKKIKVLWEQLGVTSIPELKAAIDEGRLATLAGFGKKTAENILKAIEDRSRHAGSFRLGDISVGAELLLGELKELPDVSQVAMAGSYRRRKEVVRDLDYIVATKDPEYVLDFFAKHPLVESIIVRGPTKCSVRLKSGIQADLRVVTNAQYPFALAYFTGSKEHNIVIRNRALARGWTLNEYRLENAPPKASGKKTKEEPLPIPTDIYTEADLHRALGLDYIAPELREDRGEIQAAENHTLPRLIELENLRGTFHCHTTASDGRNTLAEMAEAARELGLQYLGIADHSRSSIQAHGLSAEQLLAQVAAIRELNKELGPDFQLLAGVECDILKDGTLDFPDEVLAQLDYVVASVHASFTLPEAEMTARIIRAMESPYVTMVAHLTGRLLLTREPYQVDIPAVIEAAARTGTILELNSNPRRLDMDWRWWPMAREKGVRCAINPDAHTAETIQYLYFGVGVGRKGWLTREDVVNTLPLGQIEKVLRQKRVAAGLLQP
jgi:DNA polymerase (family X)